MKEKNSEPISVENAKEEKIIEFALQDRNRIIIVRNESKIDIYEKEMIIFDLIEKIDSNSIFFNISDVKKFCNIFDKITENDNNTTDYFTKLIHENSTLYEQKFYNFAEKLWIEWQDYLK